MTVSDVKVANLLDTVSIADLTPIVNENPYKRYFTIKDKSGNRIGDLHVSFSISECSVSSMSVKQINDRNYAQKESFNDDAAEYLSSRRSVPLLRSKSSLPSEKVGRKKTTKIHEEALSRESASCTRLENLQRPLKEQLQQHPSGAISDRLVSDILKRGQNLRNRIARSLMGENEETTKVSSTRPDKLSEYLLGKDLSKREKEEAVRSLTALSPVESLVEMCEDLAMEQENVAHQEESARNLMVIGKNLEKNKPVKDNRIIENKPRSTSATWKRGAPEKLLPRTKSAEPLRKVGFVGPSQNGVPEQRNVWANLNTNQQTVLRQVDAFRVWVYRITLLPTTLANMTMGKSKPCFRSNPGATFTVEYCLPSINQPQQKPWKTYDVCRTTRICSRKQVERVIYFNQSTDHKIIFDNKLLEKWWEGSLEFHVFSRHLNQRVPSILGKAKARLQDVLLSGTADSTQEVNLKLNEQVIGTLRLKMELGLYHRSYGKEFVKPFLNARKTNKVDRTSSTTETPFSTSPSSTPRHILEKKDRSSATVEIPRIVIESSDSSTDQEEPEEEEDERTTKRHLLLSSKKERPKDAASQSTLAGSQQAHLLHCLLTVAEGKLSPEDGAPWNLYLATRMFFCDETAKSETFWNDIEPQFGFREVIPVLINSYFLERCKNNYMVVEVWNRQPDEVNDLLVGLSKLPIHQFYLSYRDPVILDQLKASKESSTGVESSLQNVRSYSVNTPTQQNVTSVQDMESQTDVWIEKQVEDHGAQTSPVALTPPESRKAIQFESANKETEGQIANEEMVKESEDRAKQQWNTIRNCFRAHVVIERALHFPKAPEHETVPICYVSYQSAAPRGPLLSPLIIWDVCPHWNWHSEAILPASLLTQEGQLFILKVWRGVGPIPSELEDTVIGFATVDLSVLRAGLPQVSGWFNVRDFAGHCKGQIRVGITPLENVTRFQLQGARHTNSSDVFIPPEIPNLFPKKRQNCSISSCSSSSMSNESSDAETEHSSYRDADLDIHPVKEQPQDQKQENYHINDVDGVSRSFLFRNLKEKLTELDEITEYWRRKVCVRDAVDSSVYPDLSEKARDEEMEKMSEQETESDGTDCESSLNEDVNIPRLNLSDQRSDTNSGTAVLSSRQLYESVSCTVSSQCKACSSKGTQTSLLKIDSTTSTHVQRDRSKQSSSNSRKYLPSDLLVLHKQVDMVLKSFLAKANALGSQNLHANSSGDNKSVVMSANTSWRNYDELLQVRTVLPGDLFQVDGGIVRDVLSSSVEFNDSLDRPSEINEQLQSVKEDDDVLSDVTVAEDSCNIHPVPENAMPSDVEEICRTCGARINDDGKGSFRECHQSPRKKNRLAANLYLNLNEKGRDGKT